MGTIYVINRMYSDMKVFIVGPDGGMGRLLIPAGSPGMFLNCPPWEYAIMAFSASNNSLQHLGKVRPNMGAYDLVPNQGGDRGAGEGQAAAGPSASYEQRQQN